MATSMYRLISTHTVPLHRSDYLNIVDSFHKIYIEDIFSKIKWRHDVFEAEYLTKKSKDDKEYEDVVHSLSNLRLTPTCLKLTGIQNREYVLKEIDLDANNVPNYLREAWNARRK